MDVLRRELDQIYSSQHLEAETLDKNIIEQCKLAIGEMSGVSGACMVITDASSDHCYLYGGAVAPLLDVAECRCQYREICSSDEDIIYMRMHPEDLVEKRLLEYEFFKFVNNLPADEKVMYKASCRIRIKNREDRYIIIDNSTQILKPSPSGKIWLILCCYDLAPVQERNKGICARISNNFSGEIIDLACSEKKNHILTAREKEILRLIKEGKLSKQIADILGISINTVNRHRQNILEKLSVSNSVEAVTAAIVMGLI